MPHLTIEYSSAVEQYIDIADLCRALHAIMVATPLFPTAGIRIRTYVAEHAIVADGHPENAFVAMGLRVGAGRSEEALRAAGDTLFAAAQSVLAEPLSKPHFALSLDIRVSDPVLSWKQTPIHTRLSAQDTP
ncbi:MAG: 5-carboxymethyl-2-hydroxymuconate Delta-isomerase [Pseudomonadota bacterium]